MRKFAVLFMICMLLGVSVCDAKIFNQKDDFTGGVCNTSIYKCDEKMQHKLDYISLDYISTEKISRYQIKTDIDTYKEFGLSDKVAKINIDSYFESDLSVLNRRVMKISGSYLYTVDYQVSQEIIDRIKTANRVALKFTQNDGSQFVFVLPNSVLAEWKEVIAMEK